MNDRELDQGVRQWEALCHKIARGAHIPPGLTYEDLLQEARLGVFNGLKDYDPAHGVPLVNYLAICAQREVWKATTAATRVKHRPLNQAKTNMVYRDGEEESIFDRLEDDPEDRPDHLVERAAEADLFKAAVARADLSDLERQVLTAVIVGGSWEQIAAEVGLSRQGAVDAMDRVTQKLAAELEAA